MSFTKNNLLSNIFANYAETRIIHSKDLKDKVLPDLIRLTDELNAINLQDFILSVSNTPTVSLSVTGKNLTANVLAVPPGLIALTQHHIFVGSAANVATDVAMSGEASIVAAGTVTLLNSAVIGKVLTGYVSGAGVVAATDTILQAIQKLNGNIAATVPLTRNLTINGSTQDLSADRTWTITTTGTAGNIVVAGGGGLTPTIDLITTAVTLGSYGSSTQVGTFTVDAYGRLTAAANAAISITGLGTALTRVDDTNVTLTLTGSPTTALVNAAGLTLGWTGTLADSRLSTTAVTPASYTVNGGALFTVGATGRLTSASNVVITVTGTANKIDVSGGTGVTPTITISGTYVGQTSITTLGTIVAGTWNATKIGLLYGGTNADLSATGGTSQVLKQASAGAAITVAQLASTDLSDVSTGTYTPACTGVLNIDSTSGILSRYIKIGSQVFVSGQFLADATITLTATTITMTVPVATANFTTTGQAGGNFGSAVNGNQGRFSSTSGAQTVTLSWNPTGIANTTYGFSFSYTIQ